MLAGVNGAGKSSILGRNLQDHGLNWFNPDSFARELIRQTGMDQQIANSLAWKEGLRRLDGAISRGENHAFETTLGGNTMTERIALACQSHDVLVWFCGLNTAADHIARVKARVALGGHDIAEKVIRSRFVSARANLLKLMPHLSRLVVYDNSISAGSDGVIPDPVLVLEMRNGVVEYPGPDDLGDLQRTPDWARPLVEAALRTRPFPD